MKDGRLIVLFICSGNVCRSPLGAAMLESDLRQEGISGVTVSSAGTLDMESRPASRYALEVGHDHGLDLSDHISRMVDENMLGEADIVVAVTPAHAEYLVELCPSVEQKIVVLDVPDPYGLQFESYKAAYSQLRDGMPIVIDAVQNKLEEVRGRNEIGDR